MAMNFSTCILSETTYKQIKRLPESKQHRFFTMFAEYGLFGIEPEFKDDEVGMMEESIWIGIKDLTDSMQTKRDDYIESQRANGQKGGKTSSERKAESARENGQKGGRPPNNPTNPTSNNPSETQADNPTKPNGNNPSHKDNVKDNVNLNIKDNGEGEFLNPDDYQNFDDLDNLMDIDLEPKEESLPDYSCQNCKYIKTKICDTCVGYDALDSPTDKPSEFVGKDSNQDYSCSECKYIYTDRCPVCDLSKTPPSAFDWGVVPEKQQDDVGTTDTVEFTPTFPNTANKTALAEKIHKRYLDAKLPCSKDFISFFQKDFKNSLQHIDTAHDDVFLQTLDNYISVVNDPMSWGGYTDKKPLVKLVVSDILYKYQEPYFTENRHKFFDDEKVQEGENAVPSWRNTPEGKRILEEAQ